MDVCNINLKIKYDENPYFDKPNEGIDCMLIQSFLEIIFSIEQIPNITIKRIKNPNIIVKKNGGIFKIVLSKQNGP